MPKTYRVRYMDARYHVTNVKLLEANSAADVLDHMKALGLRIIEIQSEALVQKMQSMDEDYRKNISFKLTELEVTGETHVYDSREFQLLKELHELDSEVYGEKRSIRMVPDYYHLCESYIVR